MKHILQVREHIGGETMAEANRIANEIAAKLGIDPGAVEIEEIDDYDDESEEGYSATYLVGQREATEAEIASPPRWAVMRVIYEMPPVSDKGWGDYLKEALEWQASIGRMPFVSEVRTILAPRARKPHLQGWEDVRTRGDRPSHLASPVNHPVAVSIHNLAKTLDCINGSRY